MKITLVKSLIGVKPNQKATALSLGLKRPGNSITLAEVVYTNLVKSSHVSNKLIDELLEDCTADELNAIAEVVKTVKKVLRNKK